MILTFDHVRHFVQIIDEITFCTKGYVAECYELLMENECHLPLVVHCQLSPGDVAWVVVPELNMRIDDLGFAVDWWAYGPLEENKGVVIALRVKDFRDFSQIPPEKHERYD